MKKLLLSLSLLVANWALGAAAPVNVQKTDGQTNNITANLTFPTGRELHFLSGSILTVDPGTIVTGISGSGTVTSIPDGSTNGVIWTVANRTSIPTFTFSLGDITPTTVNGITFLGAGTMTFPLLSATLARASAFDIRDYGAIGDDSTDNTTPIQNAVNAASSAGGGSVLIPAGIFRTGQIALKNSVRIFGIGNASVLKLKNSGNNYVLANIDGTQYVDDVIIEDLAIDGNKANNTSGGGIDFTGRRCIARNNYIFNTVETGIILGPANGGTSNVPDAGHSLIYGNTIFNASKTNASQYGAIAITHGTQIIVAHNLVQSTDGFQTYGIEVETNTGNSGSLIEISNNVVVGGRIFADFANSSSAGTQISLIGNLVDARGSASPLEGYGAPIFLRNVDGLKVSNNHLIGHADGPYGGINTLATITNFEMSDNLIEASLPVSGSSYGIYFENLASIASNGLISGNQIVGIEGSISFGIFQNDAAGFSNVNARGNNFVNVTTPYFLGTTAISVTDFVQFTGVSQTQKSYALPNVSTTILTANDSSTGTGALVRANTPTLIAPVIGAATGISLNLSAAPWADLLSVNGRIGMPESQVLAWRYTDGNDIADMMGVRVDANTGYLVGRVRVAGTVTESFRSIAGGNFSIPGAFISTVTTGTAPLTVSSTTLVANLHAATADSSTTATTATNATNTAVTDDTTTNATMYPTWVTTTTGNLPQKLSSTKLTFNPSTGLLSATSFSGTSPTFATSLLTGSTTFALLNATATTVNAFGAATTVNTGASATQIWNFGGSTTASEFRFLEPSGSGTNYSAFKAVAQGANITYSLPATVGAAGTFLRDNAGNGVLDWATPSGSGNVTNSGTLTSTALVTGAGTTVVQTPSATATLDSSGNISLPGTITTGSGGGTTGNIVLSGTTSGALKITGADAMAQTVTMSLAAQTTGNATLTIPDLAGTNKNMLVSLGTAAIASGKTLTVSNSLTLAGTDSTTMTFPGTSATIARTDAANTFTGVQTMTSAALTTPVITTSMTLANGTSPTTGAVAVTAFDTDAWAASRGAIQVHDGTANTYVVAALASDTPTNGQVPTWNTGGTITWETPGAGSGDMILASVQTVTGAKTFGTIGGAVGKFILAGSSTGSTIVNAAAAAGSGTWTLQTGTDTFAGLGTSQTFTGIETFTPTLRSSGAASFLTITTPADTGQTASTEAIGVNKTAAIRQWATGTLTTQREVLFGAPTYGFVGASTLTTAINVDIPDPIAGTNATFTNTYGLRVNNQKVTGTLTANTGTNLIGPLVDSVDGTTPLNNIVETTASGTAYTLTTSFAALDFGTTDPVIVLPNAGTYTIQAWVQTTLAGATTTTQTVSFKMRRTNNTAADVGDTSSNPLPVATVGSPLGPSCVMISTKYTTAATNDSITIQGLLSASLGAGSITCTAAHITAIRAY